MLGHLLAGCLHEVHVAVEPAVVVPVLAAVELALEVVIAGRTVPVPAGLSPMLDDLLDPPLFCLGSRVYRPIAVAADIVDAGRDVIALGIENIRQTSV